ncbi:MAG TPA: DUF4446 family protein [Candidatus Paceibacterota bacterium]
MYTSLEIIVFSVTGLAILIGAFWIFSTEKRLKRFFLGKKGKDLEDTITALEKEIAELKSRKVKIETIRFNPFSDQGSNQSFAIGILNEEEDGVVISSLYSRERMSVFAKPIKGGKSEYELSSEEKDVLKKAKV